MLNLRNTRSRWKRWEMGPRRWDLLSNDAVKQKNNQQPAQSKYIKFIYKYIKSFRKLSSSTIRHILREAELVCLSRLFASSCPLFLCYKFNCLKLAKFFNQCKQKLKILTVWHVLVRTRIIVVQFPAIIYINLFFSFTRTWSSKRRWEFWSRRECKSFVKLT